MIHIDRLFGQYKVFEEKGVGKATEKGRRRALAKFMIVLGILVFMLLVTSVISLPVGQAAFPGANGKIAFQTFRDVNAEVYAMNADGSGQTNLSNNSANDYVPTWSPDGTKIAFPTDRDGNLEIYVMNADGSSQTRLTNNSAADFVPTWSPDGTKIAFTSNRDGNQEIYAMNADGSSQTRLTNNPTIDDQAAWSPDGTKIAFQTDRDGNDEIYVMDANGSNQTNLTNHTGKDNDPSWSPAGTQIAFSTERDSNFEIYVMDANGSNQTNLSNNSSATDITPAWSPDGTKIAFMTDRDGNFEVYTMNTDGSNPTNLTNNSGVDGWPDWQREVQNQPPDCSAAAPSISTLWPPNHQFVPVNVLGVTDPDGDPVSITITSIFQDEPVNAPGSGNTSPDGQGVGSSTAQVRAERVNGGNGRVYHISFIADDGQGGTCSGEVLVGVPPNQNATPVDDGALYDSTVP